MASTPKAEPSQPSTMWSSSNANQQAAAAQNQAMYPDMQQYLRNNLEKEKRGAMREHRSAQEIAFEENKAKAEKLMTSPHADPTLDETPEDKYQQRLEVLYSHIKNSVTRLQIKVGERMHLNQILGECLETRCNNLKEKATEVIDDVSDRKFNKKSKELILDAEEFIRLKHTHIDEAVAFERAAICMQDCQLPLDAVKRILASNVR